MQWDSLLEDKKTLNILSRVVTHLMGDGCVTNRYFAYCNQDKTLLNNFERDVKILFGEIHITRAKTNSNTYILMIQNKSILSFLRSLLEDYRSSYLELPFFIKENKDIQKEFLKEFFDDEGCVAFRVFRKTGELKRNLTLSSNSIKLLNEIKRILYIHFGIESNKILKYVKTNREKIYTNYILSITGKENFIKFMEKIAFSTVAKNSKLKIMINSYIRK